jgi:sugar lactone lactonase YvrE
MLDKNIELVIDAQNMVGESPVWSAKEQALYWVDIPLRKINRLSFPSLSLTTWTCPEMVGCIAPNFDLGYWIVGAESGIFKFTIIENLGFSFEAIAPVSHLSKGMRFNDGRLDRKGKFLAGTMVMNMALAQPYGGIYSLAGDALKPALRKHLDGFLTPNGMAFSPDGQLMYLSDSHPHSQKIWSFKYDDACGEMYDQKLFFDMSGIPGRPDGAAVDVDGCYWICGNDAGMVYRITPEGSIDQKFQLPIKKPAMCSFGGSNLDTLLITSIRPMGVDLTDQPLAGGVFSIKTTTQGIEEVSHRF